MKRAGALLLATMLTDGAMPAPDVWAQATPGNAVGSQTGDSGGAFAGLASAPEANLFTGVAQTSIPIEVPPGRLGLAPVLALSYSSSFGATQYGNGWTLGLPRIHRSTRNGVPRYTDADSYVLEMPGGAVELERVALHRYRADPESAFLRIGFDDDDNTWKVMDKLGVSFVFGTTAATRTGRANTRNGTFAWLLESMEDPAGNRIDFVYRPGGADGTSTGLPEFIRYGANTRTGLPHFAEVAFSWTTLLHAGTPRTSWRDGYADVLDVRLTAIETSTHGLPARRYDFSHEEDPVSADLRLVGVTLTAFAENASDDIQLPSTVFVYAPALHAGWPARGTPSPGEEPFEIPTGGGFLRLGGNAVTVDSVDLNGDGLIDRIDTVLRPLEVRLGTGRGFEDQRSWNWPTATSAPRAIRKTDGNGNLLSNVFDLDGDGFADLVDSNPSACGATAGVWCVWRGGADGFAGTASRWKSRSDQLRTTASGGSKIVVDLVDVDADGRFDLLDASSYDESASDPHWNLYRNTGTGFSLVAENFAAPFPYLARTSGGRLVYGLLDINADSLPDLVVADPRGIDNQTWWGAYEAWQVHFNTGKGLSREATQWPIDEGVGDGPGLPNFINLHAQDGSNVADLFDITGDGRPDLVRRTQDFDGDVSGIGPLCRYESRCTSPDVDGSAVSQGRCCFHLLVFVNTGSSFSQPVGWSAPAHGLRAGFDECPYVDSSCWKHIYDFDFFDIDGDGLVDFIERDTTGGKPFGWLVHPHPASPGGGSARPNVLLSMRNGVGGETMLRYSVAAGTPDTRLPFPHWMVTEREVRDSIFDQTPLRTSFAYRGGYFDTAEREMRGFSLVQEVDPVGTVRAREFHQDRRRAGRLRRLTSLAPPPCVAVDPEDPNDACSPWKFPLGLTEYDWPAEGPVLLQRESDVPCHDGSPVENLRRTTEYEYDSYGNVTRRRITTPMAPATTTTTQYEHKVAERSGLPVTYVVAKPRSVRIVEDGRGSPLVERTFEYEWEAPAPASLSAASTCMAWDGMECTRWSRRSFEYEAEGNMVVARAPTGATSRTEYDEQRLFAVRSTDPVGLLTTSATEPRMGLVTETVAPNGNRLRSRYDGLGRLVRAWGPGTSKQDPLRILEYAPGALGDSPPRVVVTEAASGRAATFFDGIGRIVATKADSSNGDVPVSVVAGLKLYDDRGLVVAESLPFDSNDRDVATLSESFEDAPAWLEFAYDEAGRLVETRTPDGSVTRVDRSAPGILRTDDANLTGGEHPGSVTLEFFDGLGHRIQRDACTAAPQAAASFECPDGHLVRRESWIWDGLGRLAESRTHSLGQAAGDSVTRIERNGLGNRQTVFHSNAGNWRFADDDNGRVTEIVKPDGSKVRMSYDAAGRILRRRGRDSSASYHYHAAGGGTGKLRRTTTKSRHARISEDLEYDNRGRVVMRLRKVTVRKNRPVEIAVAYQYDDLDRRISTEYPGWEASSESIVRTDYDGLGRQIGLWADAVSYVRGARYDSEGRLLRTDYANGLSDLIEYELRSNELGTSGYLRCLRTTGTPVADGGACDSSAADVDALSYVAYDRLGNLLGVADPLHAAGDPRRDTRIYAYDALGRLERATYENGDTDSFAFDPLGNLTRNGSVSLGYADSQHPSQLRTRRVARGDVVALEHDPIGRRTRDGEREFFYDDFDRLTQVAFSGEPVRRYGYSDTGEKIYAQDLATGHLEIELGDGLRIDGDRIERTLVFAGRPIAVESRTIGLQNSATTRRFLHHDHQRSVRTVTDESGHAVEYSRYAPYGRRRAHLGADGRPLNFSETRFGYTGQIEDRDAELLFFGARHYDPVTGSFLTLDPAMQFASPYAYSGGNPVLGRDADGSVFELTALEIIAILTSTATFIDTVVSTGDLGQSLTAGVFAGFSVYASHQMSTMLARPLARSGHIWLQMAASVASDGFQAISAVEAIEDGRYAGGIVAAGMLAASLIGIESANDPGSGTTPAETHERHGIQDRGMIENWRVIDVNGICSTRPGCITNTLIAARENLRVLFGGQAQCVGGCEHVADVTGQALSQSKQVLLRCNSFGAIKCLGAIQQRGVAEKLASPPGSPTLKVEMSGAPLLRPPRIHNVTYQVNLFDPVVWVGTAYAAPFRSDVVLGRNWWVPTPVIVHHSRMYERPFHEALGEMAK